MRRRLYCEFYCIILYLFVCERDLEDENEENEEEEEGDDDGRGGCIEWDLYSYHVHVITGWEMYDVFEVEKV